MHQQPSTSTLNSLALEGDESSPNNCCQQIPSSFESTTHPPFQQQRRNDPLPRPNAFIPQQQQMKTTATLPLNSVKVVKSSERFRSPDSIPDFYKPYVARLNEQLTPTQQQQQQHCQFDSPASNSNSSSSTIRAVASDSPSQMVTRETQTTGQLVQVKKAALASQASMQTLITELNTKFTAQQNTAIQRNTLVSDDLKHTHLFLANLKVDILFALIEECKSGSTSATSSTLFSAIYVLFSVSLAIAAASHATQIAKCQLFVNG